MEQSHSNETNANKALSDLIKRVMHGRQTRAEATRIIKNHAANRPDIVITAPGRSPVVIEAEYLPAHDVEEEANALRHRFAGRCHLTVDYTLGFQPLSVAFAIEPCIGGRAWPNVNFAKKDWDYAFSIWGNSTLGLLLFWWHSTRQQSSKASMSIRAAETLPVLNFRALSQAQIKQAKRIFDQFKDKHFLPAYVADKDETREKLDRAVLCEWLGFEESIFQAVHQLAHKWCAEPSVHGGKQRHKNILLEKK